MSYKKIGVFGATGQLGQEVTRALAEAGFEVVPFSRQDTTVASIPTQKVGSLVGFDAIVSTVGPQGWTPQVDLIAQAKREGVKRFIPSEFGMDHRGIQSDFFAPKENAFKATEEAEFPDGWTAFINGFFESVIPAFAKWDLAAGTVQISGQGVVKYPFVVRHDIGRVLAHTLKNPAQYKNKWLVLANDWLSAKDIAQIASETAGKELKVEYTEADEKKTPVIYLLEKKGGNVFDPNLQTKDLPLELVDLKAYVKTLVK